MHRRSICCLILFLCAFFSSFHPDLVAQQTEGAAASIDNKALLDRIDQLERRVRELEAAKGNNVTTAGSVGTASQQNPDEIDPSIEHGPSAALAKAVETKTGLQIRGFGQVSIIGHDMHRERAFFSVGNLTLLLSSRLSDRVTAIGEVAFDQEGSNSPEFGVVVERAVLRYEHNDHFKIDAGRYYSSIGYYNTAFHNADWAQTAMRRPLIATFQDDGGVMPMQRTGISVSGRLPSGKLGLHYVAEFGGGDVVRADGLGLGYKFPIQARPGFNLALFARPPGLSGVQIGGSFFHDSEMPILGANGNPLVRQNIYSAYAVYHTSRWEFLNEAYLIHHGVKGFRDFNIPAFYTQVSYRLTPAWRPYFRYSDINAGQRDPMLLGANGGANGVEAGARYNFSEWVGLKIEYARMNIGHPKLNINFGGTQLVFTF